MAKNSSTKWRYAIGLFVIAVAIVLARLLPQETLEQAARNYDRCLLNKNTGCMFDYMHPDEPKTLGITEDNFDRFMVDYYYRQLDGFVPASDLTLDLHDNDYQLSLSANRRMRHSDGREIYVTFSIGMSDHGPIISGMVISLLFSSCFAEQEKNEPRASGIEVPKLLSKCYTKHLPTFLTANVRGYTRMATDNQSKSIYRMVKFDDAISGWNRIVERAEKRQSQLK